MSKKLLYINIIIKENNNIYSAYTGIVQKAFKTGAKGLSLGNSNFHIMHFLQLLVDVE